MARIFRNVTTHPFKVDVHTIVRNQGRQIDWETIGASTDPDPVTSIPAGTIMTELESGLIVPYTFDEGTPSMILESGANQGDERFGATTGYGCIVGGVIYANLLPDAEDAGFDAALAALADAGTGFVFETYSDDRAESEE